jgi:hypothetical protein
VNIETQEADTRRWTIWLSGVSDRGPLACTGTVVAEQRQYLSSTEWHATLSILPAAFGSGPTMFSALRGLEEAVLAAGWTITSLVQQGDGRDDLDRGKDEP